MTALISPYYMLGCGYREQITNIPVGDGTCTGFGFIHYYINWGWGGQYNGFYAMNNLNPGNDGQFDTWMRRLIHIKQ